jgi:hypothetical protein
MFQRLDESSGRVIGFKLSGKLTDADYEEVVPQIESAIEESGKICMLWELEDFHGWDAKAAWDDLKSWIKFRHDLDRIAIVGEKAWEKWMTKLVELFPGIDAKYFDHSQIQDAWGWLREEK